jgi:hypothetical protein
MRENPGGNEKDRKGRNPFRSAARLDSHDERK